jgi:hypothetical protein
MKHLLSIILLFALAFFAVKFFGVAPNVETMAIAITGLIGTASVACQMLAVIAKITPSTRDDRWVTGITEYLSYLSELLDMLAFNLSKEQAKTAKKHTLKGVVDDD